MIRGMDRDGPTLRVYDEKHGPAGEPLTVGEVLDRAAEAAVMCPVCLQRLQLVLRLAKPPAPPSPAA
jgi:hypothetical protein